MAVCPSCGAPPASLVLEESGEVLVARPPASFSLAGMQMKVSASRLLKYRLTCAYCGWNVEGYLSNDGRYLLPIDPDGEPDA